MIPSVVASGMPVGFRITWDRIVPGLEQIPTDIVPLTDSAYDIGTSSKRFAVVYADTLDAASLILDQLQGDDFILELRSTGDVAHALVSQNNTATYGAFAKTSGPLGGLFIRGLGEDANFQGVVKIEAIGGQADTTKSSAGRALIELYAKEHDGAGAYANITADGNVLAVIARVGGSDVALEILDEDGDKWLAGGLTINVGPITSGVYTPTLTNVANLDASTAYECQYMRVGAVVTVSGKVDVDPTAPAASTQLGISLPIASNLGAAEDCAGSAFASGIAGQGAAIVGDAANDRAQMQWVSGDVTNQPMYFTFTYAVI